MRHIFSLVLDESTEVSNSSQFSVIARYVVGDTLHEESLAVLTMKGTTNGRIYSNPSLSPQKREIYRWINLFRFALMVLRAWWGKQRIRGAAS